MSKFVEITLEAEKTGSTPKISTSNGETYISGGYQGKVGNYVVDDAECPRFLIGKLTESGLVRINKKLSE